MILRDIILLVLGHTMENQLKIQGKDYTDTSPGYCTTSISSN